MKKGEYAHGKHKRLVACFSASGSTREACEHPRRAAAGLSSMRSDPPLLPYERRDLNWMDKRRPQHRRDAGYKLPPGARRSCSPGGGGESSSSAFPSGGGTRSPASSTAFSRPMIFEARPSCLLHLRRQPSREGQARIERRSQRARGFTGGRHFSARAGEELRDWIASL